MINLFNLLPVVPLDGGRITAALHPALWLVRFLGLLGLAIGKPNPILIIILLFSGSGSGAAGRCGHEMQENYRVKPTSGSSSECSTSVARSFSRSGMHGHTGLVIF